MTLIEAPSNLGLKEPAPGIEPGVKFFPGSMAEREFASKAGIGNILRIDAPPYSMDIDAESKVRNAAAIVDYSNKLAIAIGEQLEYKDPTVVIGGDCSILIGAALALKRAGNYGLFFLDGHTDYVLPDQSGSLGAAGMDLAIVTGNGHNKLTNIGHLKPYIQEEHVFCVGNRDISLNWYVNAIVESNVHYYDLPSLRSEGIPVVVKEFLDMVDLKHLDGFWIHFDVDVLDNVIMPCVDSPQENGLSYEELGSVLRPLLASPLFAGIDVTIFDPTLDEQGIYATHLANEVGKILRQFPVKSKEVY
jgi:arginase